MNINSLEEIEEMVDNLQKELDIIGTSKYIDSDDGLSAGELSESEFTKLRIKSEIDEKKRKEFFQFAGIYSVKTVLLPRNSERVKNISLISMDNKYNYLFEWPGIYKDKPTELPGANMCQIMEKALDSFSQLKKEFNYRNYALSMLKIPESLFFVTYTEMSLFDRMSINYVKFLKESMDYSKFRKRFMNISNNILPQYETNTSLFDVNSNSPLIENYMKLTKKYKNVGTANYFNFVEQTPIKKEIQRNIKNMDNDLDK
ncbi:hypothetical protein A3Q56_01972 [Intoshia linei]|uniref:Uncharacterized protein n=1 Tax=Intoshia linei TaxID=1819745 RepID=A0A177B7P2_9BILA|nr:hypothetical protein A3Q56_01972 [Intoshia linei]